MSGIRITRTNFKTLVKFEETMGCNFERGAKTSRTGVSAILSKCFRMPFAFNVFVIIPCSFVVKLKGGLEYHIGGMRK